MRALVRAILEAAVARGEIRKDTDLDAMAGVIHALTVVLGDSRMLPYLDAYLQLQTKDVPADRTLSAALDLVVRGLEPQAGRSAAGAKARRRR